MRVFVPATLPLLERWRAARLIDAPTGFAVTPALREWYAAGDTEELEYTALTHAAMASITLLAADGAAPARRVVVAADAQGAVPEAANGRSAVRLASPLGFGTVAAVHVDDPEAEPVVRAAAAAVGAADAGDPDAEFAMDEAAALELSWYASQEIPDLLLGS
jgi:hypothetical protein